MSTKRAASLYSPVLRGIGPVWSPNPNDPAAASTALVVAVALLRALRDRGLLSEGEIDDLFGEAAERLRGAGALFGLDLLYLVRSDVQFKDEEEPAARIP